MAKPKPSDLKIVMDDTESLPMVYSNHQGVSRTALEFTIVFNRIRVPLEGVPADNTLHATPLIEVVMPVQAAVGLLETMAAQLGRKVEPTEQERKPSGATRRARTT